MRHRFPFGTLVPLVAFLVFPAGARAQGTDSKPAVTVQAAAQTVVGKKIWIVRADGSEAKGQLIAATANEVELSGPSGSTQIALADIRQLGTRTGGHAVLGIVIGAVAGIAVGTFSAATSDGTKGGGTIVGLGVGLGAVGGLLGAATSYRVVLYDSNSSTAAVSVRPDLSLKRAGMTVSIKW